MLTTKYVKDNVDAIRKSLKKRKSDYPLDELLKLDEEYNKISTEAQQLRAKRNKGSLEVAELKKAGKGADKKIDELSGIKARIDEIELQLPKYQVRIDALLWNMPNTLHESVPYGKDDSENVEVRKWGKPRAGKTVGHEEALKRLGLLDIEKAAEVAGARFYYLKGDLVMLEQSLIRFTMDFMVKKGYLPIAPPFMLKKRYYMGATALGEFEEVLYKVEGPKEADANNELEKVEDDLFLISTSEHAIAAMLSDSVHSGNDLPLKFVGISPNFRREAGAHGKDTKGIFRVHQFYKVEQFVVSKPEDSWKLFDEMMGNAEEIFKELELPYRIVNICTGDIGTVAAKKYDLEVYMPVSGKYRELISCSNCTDWQSVRLGIKYDERGERRYAYTLNSTASGSIERAMVAIVENYLNADGTITVPKALVPYMGKSKIG
ncbi:MAG: serine--tRNA ligase [Candidatus Micrarchaeota archaeon]|nr:serine--tRNA ligase [Candidatus Micrarchaeota archaeon]